ncbi:MAG: hypothetical protein ACM3VT_13815 [Solirubrobacterales bacterium]
MKEVSSSIRIESRWLAGVAVMAVVALVAILPGRISLYPVWVPYVLGAAMIVPMAGAVLTVGKGRWERIERITNVLAFSLLYRQLDRGGPGARENLEYVKPDWQSPQTGCPDDALAGWQPTFVDYLFLGYSTATAFSPTDALPLSSRAKLLMMLESTISLVTIVVVASRAINILEG